MQGRWVQPYVRYGNNLVLNSFYISFHFFFLLQIIFLETICNDVDIIERNIRFKIQQSPDYAEV